MKKCLLIMTIAFGGVVGAANAMEQVEQKDQNSNLSTRAGKWFETYRTSNIDKWNEDASLTQKMNEHKEKMRPQFDEMDKHWETQKTSIELWKNRHKKAATDLNESKKSLKACNELLCYASYSFQMLWIRFIGNHECYWKIRKDAEELQARAQQETTDLMFKHISEDYYAEVEFIKKHIGIIGKKLEDAEVNTFVRLDREKRLFKGPDNYEVFSRSHYCNVTQE